jgi:hypothetical protein
MTKRINLTCTSVPQQEQVPAGRFRSDGQEIQHHRSLRSRCVRSWLNLLLSSGLLPKYVGIATSCCRRKPAGCCRCVGHGRRSGLAHDSSKAYEAMNVNGLSQAFWEKIDQPVHPIPSYRRHDRSSGHAKGGHQKANRKTLPPMSYKRSERNWGRYIYPNDGRQPLSSLTSTAAPH